VAGTHGAYAAIAALHYRNRTGKGQLVEIPQIEVATGMLGQFLMDYSLNGRQGEAVGNRDYHGAAPQGVYPCAGEDRWLALTVCDDAGWQAAAQVLGHPEWAADARFATAEARRANHDALDQLVAAETRGRDAWDLTRALQARGVAAGPVMDARDAFEDEHLRARGQYQRLFQVDCGERDWVGPFIRDMEGPVPVHRPPVAMGEDNEYVYKTILGYSDAAYDDLLANNHIGDRFDESIP
jgi:benzylsuccinate CoA-transferase BbsF subunit